MSRWNSALLLTGLLVLPACATRGSIETKVGSDANAGTERQTAPQEPGSRPAAGSVDRGDTTSPTMGSVHIDERIVTACGILTTPHFAFDSAKIEGYAALTLDAVATCFTTGPLEGKTIILVGRADPRGTEMHNLGLGEERASSVRTYLRHKGVDETRVMTRSLGELGSVGVDEKGWARDRRVDIFLAD